MVSYPEALQKILAAARPLPTQTVPLSAAVGHISAAPVTSPIATPSFDNSAMDGFAVIAAESRAAGEGRPVTLEVHGVIPAGVAATAAPARRQTAWEIMTGAPMPQGYDAVVRVEEVEVTARHGDRPVKIRLHKPVTMGENIRRAGEDFGAGDTVIGQNEYITPAHLMGLASVGIARVSVYQRPVVSLIFTGKELVEPGTTLSHAGQIYNANADYLRAALPSLGAAPADHQTLTDDEPGRFVDHLKALLSNPTRPHLVLSTGAVSAGAWDFIPEALRTLGATLLFHKVKIRPGKPILFAVLPGGMYFFGLPGNPISAAVGLRFFVAPLIRALQGLPQEAPVMARLASAPIKKKGDLRYFYKARVETDAMGQRRVHVLDGQESFKIRPMIAANGWAVLREGHDHYAPDEPIEFFDT